MNKHSSFSIGAEARKKVWGMEFLAVLKANLKKFKQKNSAELLQSHPTPASPVGRLPRPVR